MLSGNADNFSGFKFENNYANISGGGVYATQSSLFSRSKLFVFSNNSA
jgi:predicted outer membrane repeat protein